MTAINDMLQEPLSQAIGWALLQFVWQGALIGLLTAGVLAALRNSAADVRYVVATIGLSLMLTMPVVTAVQTLKPAGALVADTAAPTTVPQSQGVPTTLRRATPHQETVGATAPANPSTRGRDPVESWLPVLVSVWLAGVTMLTLRLLSGWIWVQRMKSHRATPAGDAIDGLAQRLTRRLHITRSVRFLESALVDVPTVIGWLKPVVLLPTSALAGLAPQQLEAILAHELAHIRRHDYLVNLLQTLVETLLFYHPAVWWVSRRIRIERENCCDDLAVSLCGDPVAYAAALAELEGLRSTTSGLALAASGGSLLQRIRRVLGAPSHAGRAPGWLAAAVAVLVMVSISASALGPDGFGASITITDGAVHSDPLPPEPALPPEAPSSPPPKASIERGNHQGDARTPARDARDLSRAVRAQVKAVAKLARAAAKSLFQATTEPSVPSSRAAAEVRATTARQESAPVETAQAASTRSDTARAEAAAVEEVVRAGEAAQAASTAAPAQPADSPQTRIDRSERDGQKSGNFSWSNNGERLDVKYRGDIEFTDDDMDVRSITPGGWLTIREGSWLRTDNMVEFNAKPDGSIERRFWVGRTEHPFDPEGRKWLAQMLPRFIRQTGIGASGRVARIMKSKGAAGVLAEISLIEGSWAKRLYFTELFKTPSLPAGVVQQALTQAGKEIDSDFELASLLISADGLATDEATRRAYFDAARTIGSDFEMRRVFSSALKKGPVSPAALAGVLDTSTSIDSDFEEASLLIQIAKVQPLDASTRTAFFNALSTVDSAFERRRVLTAVLERTNLSPEVLTAVLESAALVRSDFERASVLLQFVKDHAVEGAVRGSFFKAVASIDSSFERGRVLQAIAKRSDVSDETVLGIIRTAHPMTSGFEKSQVLLAVAGGHQLTREGRDAYLDAAENLGDFEHGRVLSALVRNEKRK